MPEITVIIPVYNNETYIRRCMNSILAQSFTDYEIIFNDSWEDNSISVYKNNKEICKVKNKSHYFNIDFEKGFYIKH